MKVIDNMKKTIKKKKAFTLIELMGVLVIIGVLSAILIPVISNALKENREKVYQSQLQNIILAAKNFASDNMFLLPETDGDSISITLGQLKKSGYLEESIVNPKTKKEFSNCMKIEIKNINNNYEYTIDESTIELESCNEEFNSDIVISGPSKSYIRNGSTSSYILIIRPSDDGQILSYNLDNSKLSLGDRTSAKYSVVGENGIYKIVIIAGETEEDISLTFEEGAITDSNGNNVDTSTVIPNIIRVDNTAPTITFTNNGSSEYTNSASTKIVVSDEKSGGDTTTYKYIYSNITSIEPNNTFSIDQEITHNTGNGEYYLIASACDKAGNCNKEISNVFNLDTAGPIITAVENQYYDQWVNFGYYVYMDITDEGIGGIKTYYSDDGTTYYEETNISGTRNYINFENERGNTVYLKSCDALNNCSEPQTTIVKIDKTKPQKPTITLVYSDGNRESYNQNWTNRGVIQQQSATDTGSGVAYFQFRHPSGSCSGETTAGEGQYCKMKSNWEINPGVTVGSDGEWTFYVQACDNAGNCSVDSDSYTIKIDKTAPTLDSVAIQCKYVESVADNRAVVTINAHDKFHAEGVGTGYYYFDAKQAIQITSWNNVSIDNIWNSFGYLSSTTTLNLRGVVIKDYAGNQKLFSCDCPYSGIYSGGCTSQVNYCNCWDGAS